MGLNVCPVGRGDCGKGMREGAGGVGPGQDVIQLFYIKSYQIRKADQRAVERLSFLNLYLNLHVCCTKWHRIKAQPEMCCNQKVCES